MVPYLTKHQNAISTFMAIASAIEHPNQRISSHLNKKEGRFVDYQIPISFVCASSPMNKRSRVGNKRSRVGNNGILGLFCWASRLFKAFNDPLFYSCDLPFDNSTTLISMTNPSSGV